VTLLLLTMWALCFAVGAYEIYITWREHSGPHREKISPPPGLPDLHSRVPPQLKLAT